MAFLIIFKHLTTYLPKGVVICVVGSLEFEIHQIDSSKGGPQEKQLHSSVVNRYEIGNQIKVPGRKDNTKQYL